MTGPGGDIQLCVVENFGCTKVNELRSVMTILKEMNEQD